MVATKENQKSTAMDYFAAPRHEGLVVGILEKVGFTAGDGGRLPAGVKYDFIKANSIYINDMLDKLFNKIFFEELSSVQNFEQKKM